jgi:MYXO-CTERM domain-containing protein
VTEAAGRTAAAAAVLLLVAVARAPLARGASCGKPDLVDMIPPDKATGVPVNAGLGAHYEASAEYVNEEVTLVRPDGGQQVLPATFDATEGFLSVTPTEPLMPGGMYQIQWPALRGLNAAAPGLGGMASFTAGSAPDVEAPSFAGLAGVSWDLERVQNDCLDALEERYVFDFDLTPVSDDGGRDGLTLILFQSAGPKIEKTAGASVPVSTRALPAEGTRPEVKLPVDEGVGHVCFAALVRDTTGKTSQSGATQVCVDTTPPPFFRGCSVAPGGAGGGGTRAGLALVVLLAPLARRKSRGARGPG